MLKRSSLIATLPTLCLLSTPVFAQSITAAPDCTGTIVTIAGQTYHIGGGTQAGANLFHSFQDFGLSQGEIANFLSAPGVAHIFGRVVGGNISVIDGLIQANPNLYLMNPAGIVFGANASLNVGGDFFATTADQVCFESGCFNSVGVNDYSSLVGSPLTFGFLQEQPGGIVNAGQLAVRKKKSLSLLGGTVVNLGELAGGHIQVAAVPGERRVRLSPNGGLLSLEVSNEVLTEGVNPLAMPELLTGVGIDLGEKVIAPGSVDLAGTVVGEQVDLYAAERVVAEPEGVRGDGRRVTRFTPEGENPTAAVFIDGRADEAEALLYGAAAGTVAQVVERDENGISVISEQLGVISEAVGALAAVAIVAEGNQGNFWLGNQWIRSENIADYGAQLQTWGAALTERADLLLYSCFTALGAEGEGLVSSLATLTGADVAASVDVTGSANYGGDWELEHQVGSIEAGNPFTGETLANWEGRLDLFTVANGNDSGVNSLRQAILDTNANRNGASGIIDEITFAPGVTLVTLTSGELQVTDDIKITGQGTNVAIERDVSAGPFRIFNISARNATIENLIIQNGIEESASGGGILHRNGAGNLILENTTISSNSSIGSGGGVWARGNIEVNNSTVSNNSSRSFGGGVWVRGDIEVNDSRVSNNSSNAGGGINGSADIIVTRSTISSNSSEKAGGGIWAGGDIEVRDSTISSNSSEKAGGGIWVRGDIEVRNSTISNNLSENSGGGIRVEGDIEVRNSTISNNSALGGGGGIAVSGNTKVIHTTISGNSSSVGGGINGGQGIISIIHSTISKNSSRSLGGGINGDQGEINVIYSTISENASRTGGGGISGAGELNVAHSIFSRNSSQGRGGGIGVGGDIKVAHSIFFGNSSQVEGGGISTIGDVVLTNSILSGNQAENADSNGVYTQTGQVTITNDGELNLTNAIRTNSTTSEIILNAAKINLFTSVQSNGGDIYINSRSDVNALTSDATISSSSSTFGGNITIKGGGDLNLRNLVSAGLSGDGGNIIITSTDGLATTTYGDSNGAINSNSYGGKAGNISISAASETTVGSIAAESSGGAGGTVNLESDSLIRLTQIVPRSLRGISNASISTAGETSGGTITIRHGGLGIVPFIVGNASINGTAGGLSTGFGQALQPIQSFLYNFTQGGIQILSTDEPAPLLFPTSGSNPPQLEFYNQSPQELFVKIIGDQLGAETTINNETGEFRWNIPNEAEDIVGQIQLPPIDILAIDEQLEGEYEDYFEEEFDEEGEALTLANIRDTLRKIESQTDTRPVLIYAIMGNQQYDLEQLSPDDRQLIEDLDLNNHLELLLISPEGHLIRKIVPNATPTALTTTLDQFTRTLQDPTNRYYLPHAQQLYTWLIAPLEAELQGLGVDTLIFAMSAGLRTIPLAALHNPQTDRFLVQDYSLGMIPSVSLTNSDYQPLHQSPVIAMGASQFLGEAPLPAVPTELAAVTAPRPGSQQYLNPEFTLANLAQASRHPQARIIHLATHARFQAAPSQAESRDEKRHDRHTYLSFWDQVVRFSDLRDLGWYNDPQIELLVLSACETALGDPYAELGFAGLAVQTGVKSTLASLWQVNDLGTLGLMSAFYQHLGDPDVTIKAEALRRAQLDLLQGRLTLQGDNIGEIALPEELVDSDRTLIHPYYWSGFTLVGSPW
ncbi:MAG: CHAT domain-containing protein [Cyanobacteria bacterium P01_G01_bin.54]